MDAMCRHDAGPQKAMDTAVKESKEDDNGKCKKYLSRVFLYKFKKRIDSLIIIGFYVAPRLTRYLMTLSWL